MQRSIDSFFKRSAPKTPTDGGDDIKRKKRKARVIESSDEDEDVVQATPIAASKKTRRNNNDRASPSPKKERLRADPNTLFGGDMVRVEAKKLVRPKEKAQLELEDDDIDQSLIAAEMDHDQQTIPLPEDRRGRKRSKTPIKTPIKTPSKVQKEESPKKTVTSGRKPAKTEAKPKTPSTSPKTEKLEKPPSKANDTPKAEKKPPAKGKSPRVKNEQHTDLETSVLSDEDRFERRRHAAQAYQHFKNRPSCFNPGSKPVPKGKSNCFSGLTFLITGVLDSLDRESLTAVVLECGGKMMTTAGKRLSYLVVGEEPGYKKLEQAKANGTRLISEDEFLNLIREKSGLPVVPIVGDEKPSTSPNKEEKKPLTTSKKATEKPSSSPKKEDAKVKEEKRTPPSEPERKQRISKRTPEKSPNNNNNNDQAVVIKKELAKPVPEENMAWVDKYKPTSVKDIIGQQGAGSNVTKLTNWLTRWYANHDGKKKLLKPSPWAKNDDGAYFKAALLSGPPGIGKTTTATLVCKELGFDAVEFNASDTRSKRLLKEEVSELLSNKSLYGYCHGLAQAVTKKHVLIMDEVDGMAGNEDRGGIQELIALIKDSSVPIVCMCNDRNHQKMRALVNYCYDLRFARPRLEQIKGRVLSICCKEKIKLDPARLEEIIASTNNDIRQSINHISLLSAGRPVGKAAPEKAADTPSSYKTTLKDLKIGPWEVVRKVFTAEEHKKMTLNDKSDLFFHDYNMASLFVQQNYLAVTPAGPKNEVMQKVALAADALSLGDLVDKRIRSNASWSLLPTLAVFSSVMPGDFMSGHFTGQINFPAWLGKNSRSMKRSRLAQEIHDHTRIRTSGSKGSIRLDYAPFLLAKIVRPLQLRGAEGVEETLAVLQEYHLLREDIDALVELSSQPGRKSPLDAVDGRVKAALTRAYNKDTLAYTYSAAAGVKKKKAAAGEDEGGDEEAGAFGLDGETEAAADSEGDEDKDKLENDALIKAKKKAAPAAAKTKPAAKATAAGRSKASAVKLRK